jgi:hypothetical protein
MRLRFPEKMNDFEAFLAELQKFPFEKVRFGPPGQREKPKNVKIRKMVEMRLFFFLNNVSRRA